MVLELFQDCIQLSIGTTISLKIGKGNKVLGGVHGVSLVLLLKYQHLCTNLSVILVYYS